MENPSSKTKILPVLMAVLAQGSRRKRKYFAYRALVSERYQDKHEDFSSLSVGLDDVFYQGYGVFTQQLEIDSTTLATVIDEIIFTSNTIYTQSLDVDSTTASAVIDEVISIIYQIFNQQTDIDATSVNIAMDDVGVFNGQFVDTMDVDFTSVSTTIDEVISL